MKKIKYFITSVVVIFALSSCGGTAAEKGDTHTHNEHEHHKEENQANETHEHNEADGHKHEKALKMNGEKKWKSDNTTFTAYSQMKDLMEAFNAKADADKNYADLAMMLAAQTDLTVSSCSMTGAPHDNLHLVLEPLIAQINLLKKNDATKKCRNYSKNKYPNCRFLFSF